MSDPFASSGRDPFGETSAVEDLYQPPDVSWQQRQPAAGDALDLQGVDDDEPFTAAHLAAATEAAVPAVPFTESTAQKTATGRIGAPLPRLAPEPAIAPSGRGSAMPASPPPALLGAAPPAGSADSDAGPAQDPSSYPFYNIKRYRRYFNVDTEEVGRRTYRAGALFFKGDFLDLVSDNPDL
jgi:hypothetical protein